MAEKLSVRTDVRSTDVCSTDVCAQIEKIICELLYTTGWHMAQRNLLKMAAVLQNQSSPQINAGTTATKTDGEGIEDCGDFYTVACPHCGCLVQVFKNEIKCTIFRHAVYKDTRRQMDPHSKKEDCDSASREGTIYGCGKPFKFDGKTVSICGYI